MNDGSFQGHTSVSYGLSSPTCTIPGAHGEYHCLQTLVNGGRTLAEMRVDGFRSDRLTYTLAPLDEIILTSPCSVLTKSGGDAPLPVGNPQSA